MYIAPPSGCGFCRELLNHGVTIESNSFEDNQDGFAFFETQKFERASQIYFAGTHDITIKSNEFHHIKNLYQMLAPRKLKFFAHWLPEDYFEGLSSPLIRVKLTNTAVRSEIIKVTVEKNSFIANHMVQPWISAQEYKGALLDISAVETDTHVVLDQNSFDDNFVRGGYTSLIYIQGPKITATSNIFYRSGQLDTTRFIRNEHPTMK